LNIPLRPDELLPEQQPGYTVWATELHYPPLL